MEAYVPREENKTKQQYTYTGQLKNLVLVQPRTRKTSEISVRYAPHTYIVRVAVGNRREGRHTEREKQNETNRSQINSNGEKGKQHDIMRKRIHEGVEWFGRGWDGMGWGVLRTRCLGQESTVGMRIYDTLAISIYPPLDFFFRFLTFFFFVSPLRARHFS